MSSIQAPPQPAPGRKITDETAPADDSIKIGIELEGVGTIQTKWSQPAVIQQANFHDVFKRTPLVRSKSYGDLRGVYIVPEDGDLFGTNSPAELVSSPHVFTKAGLVQLRNSVWKAIRKTDFVRTGKAVFKDPREPVPDDPPEATSRWGRATVALVGGSLQTTIGVAVGKMLSDDAKTREAVAGMLIGDEGKRTGFIRLAAAAVSAGKFLTAVGNPWAAHQASQEGVRLALFMAFTIPAMPSLPGYGKGWGKEAYGCNVKAESSFLACGISGTAPPVGVTQTERDDFKTALLSAMRTDGIDDGLLAALKTGLDPSDIGKPGLSLQTSVEKWFGIRNFLKSGHLYCVIEVREKEANLNKKMAGYFNLRPAINKLPGPTEPDGKDLYARDVAAKAILIQKEVSDILAM